MKELNLDSNRAVSSGRSLHDRFPMPSILVQTLHEVTRESISAQQSSQALLIVYVTNLWQPMRDASRRMSLCHAGDS